MSKIRESARDEDCTIRIPGICNFDTATTVLAHGNGSAAGKGMGMKSHDLISAYACFNCHQVVDGQRKPPNGWTRDDVRLAFYEGHARTICRLIEKGLLVLERGKMVMA